MYKSTRKKIEVIRDIVDKYYEPGRQDRCKLWIWRNIVYPQFNISERTFFRYLADGGAEDTDDGQLSLSF